jgi:hypothetical protein
LLYINNALSAIKTYAIISILASIDAKMLSMISNIDTVTDMVTNPLEYNSADDKSLGAIKRVWKKYHDPKSKIDEGSLILTILNSVLAGLLNFSYLCVYFYFSSFYPIVIIRGIFHNTRNTPCENGKASYCK